MFSFILATCSKNVLRPRSHVWSTKGSKTNLTYQIAEKPSYFIETKLLKVDRPWERLRLSIKPLNQILSEALLHTHTLVLRPARFPRSRLRQTTMSPSATRQHPSGKQTSFSTDTPATSRRAQTPSLVHQSCPTAAGKLGHSPGRFRSR